MELRETSQRIERVITDNSVGTLIIWWDSERFALLERDKVMPDMPINKVIILNPREAKEFGNFIQEVGSDA